MDTATFRERHKDVWEDDPADLMAKYKYLPEITAKLDNTPNDGLDQQRLFEIALWKMNRYPMLSDELLAELWVLKDMAPGVHRGASIKINSSLFTR